MWQKITNFALLVHLTVAGFIKGFKNDERGLSGVVVAVLLILIGVLLAVILWGLLDGWLQELWEQITGAAEEIG